MSAEKNKQVVQQFFSLSSGAGSGVNINDLFSEDIVWQVPQSNPDIKPNPRVGLAAVLDLMASGSTIFETGTMNVQIQRMLADQDCVTAQFTMEAKMINGKDYKNHYVMIFSLEQGKICGVWEYLDTYYLRQQRQS